MKTREALEHVLNTRGLTKYALAKELGCSSSSVDQWLRNTKMSTKYAKKFKRLYRIDITDAFTVSPWRKTNMMS